MLYSIYEYVELYIYGASIFFYFFFASTFLLSSSLWNCIRPCRSTEPPIIPKKNAKLKIIKTITYEKNVNEMGSEPKKRIFFLPTNIINFIVTVVTLQRKFPYIFHYYIIFCVVNMLYSLFFFIYLNVLPILVLVIEVLNITN